MKRNIRLHSLIVETGLSYDAVARHLRAVGKENGVDLSSCGRSHVAHWVGGTRPSRQVPALLAEVLSRRLGRLVSIEDIGLAMPRDDDIEIDWSQHAVDDLLSIGRADVRRRSFAGSVLYSVAALAMPLERWCEIAQRGETAARGGTRVGHADIEAVHEMLDLFQSFDERLGGDHGRLAIAEYLVTDVASFLTGRYATRADRQAMFSAAAELTFVAGWKAFDSGAHGLAERYFLTAVRLAADRCLAAYILRAVAHQAADLGHGQQCLDLSDAALTLSQPVATPGTTALFTLLRARGLALIKAPLSTVEAVVKAERLLDKADSMQNEPHWLRAIGFGEAILASQAAHAFRDLGDHKGAEIQFRRSVALRDGTTFPRIHGLTLAHLGNLQARLGKLDQAMTSWDQSLTRLSGMRSHRARQAIRDVDGQLRALGSRLPPAWRQLAERIKAELRLTG
jgi:tetratricopeptide (TPR) repeat protein